MITICPDSFKGSISAKKAAQVMEKACKQVLPVEEVVTKPMADGGEGTVDALIFATKSKRFHKEVTGPFGEKVQALYGWNDATKTAYIEIAEVAGLVSIPVEKRDPMKTTSYGLGELIIHALDNKAERVIVGLGGSATNDGGLGMLQALGAKFFSQQKLIGRGFGEDLLNVEEADLSGLDRRLQHTEISVATDVTNPLCGPEGASYIFGPQKGASSNEIAQLDDALNKFAEMVEKKSGHEYSNAAGSGAAGGLGFALLVAGGKLVSGAELVSEIIKLEEEIMKSELVLTGEGQSDRQTLFGKAPGYVAGLANKHDVPVVVISGGIDDEDQELNKHFSGVFSIMERPMSVEESMERAEELLFNQTVRVLQFYKYLKN
ncbi:glycerate kinase [Halalkalibacillus sediminis]|uniref:Glycerate kinase n=1 Tax=Halalkalibacillus sediminis TaxID=2018042 RepID=A0A2I0QRX1_9BACI|nr:glycerate kinase [Halalkalibacillus sediminis]PKR77087.1 glycerate kinase [Halalkalibacillus sediminis]